MTDSLTQKQRKHKRWGSLKSELSNILPEMQDAARLVLPRTGRFLSSDRNKFINRRNNKIYDSTGTKALRTLSAGLMGGATSPARPWLRVTVSDPDLRKYAPVKVWLKKVTNNMLDTFRRSNTYRALPAYYDELGVFGTGAGFLMDDFEKTIHHYNLTAGEYAIGKDYKGRVDSLGREFDTTVSGLVGEFGYKNCSATVRNMYDNGNYDQWITIIHVIEPRRDRDVRNPTNKHMPFQSCYFEKGADDGKFLRDSGLQRFRALCPRWNLLSGDIYGTSPAMDTIGDIKQLQHEQLRKAQCIDFETNPMLQVPLSLKNQEHRRVPGGVIYADGNQTVKKAYDANVNLGHLREDIVDVRQRINSNFYHDLFLMLANDTRSGITATEIAERHEEKLLMLGPVLERIHHELLEPMVEITFERMIEVGAVPPPPEELQNAELDIEFVSMLAQAQKAVNTNAVDRFINTVGQIGAIKPAALDKIDEDKAVDTYADQLGVDPELIVADEKVALVRQKRAEDAQAMQQAEQVQQTANVANTLGNTPRGDQTALDDVMDMFSGY